MRTIQENNFRRKISAFLGFIKNPSENLFCGIFCKAVPEVITDSCEVRNRFIQKIPQKPAIGNVQIDFLHGTPQRRDSIKMLAQYHLKQDNGIHTGTSIVCTVKLLCKVINMRKVDCTVNFS